MLNTFAAEIKIDRDRGKYDIAQELWCWIQEFGEYIYEEYTMKYFYFEGNFEYDDMEELCSKGVFSVSTQWDISIPYDIWEAKKWFYVYFLIPTKYENAIDWEMSSRFLSREFPANINRRVSQEVNSLIIEK